jgi:hypothetical protein
MGYREEGHGLEMMEKGKQHAKTDHSDIIKSNSEI